jgi:hypothetical protein
VEAFLLVPALLVQSEKFGLREGIALGRGHAGFIQGKVSKQPVKIVATQRGDSLRSDHRMHSPVQFHQRGIKSATTHVVD